MSEPAPESLSAAFDRIEKLLEFPTVFPMKVIGQRVDGLAQAVAETVSHHVPDFDPATIELRTSSKGSYLSVTVTPTVTDRHQLEGLYRALSEHPLVRIVM